MTRTWLALSLLLAAPAHAAPLMPAGSAGAVIPYTFAGPLGTSGLVVEATPTMVRLTGVLPGSPAALADVPAPGQARVRLAAVNGEPVESMSKDALLRAFSPAAGHVSLTFARFSEGTPGERLVGPYELGLSGTAIAERQARRLLAEARYGAFCDLLKVQPAIAGALADTMLLAAQDLARAGDHWQAIALASRVPAGSPGHAESRRLVARARLAHAQEVLKRADALAADGQYQAALQVVAAITGDGPWQTLKADREASWREALAAREAHRKARKKR